MHRSGFTRVAKKYVCKSQQISSTTCSGEATKSLYVVWSGELKTPSIIDLVRLSGVLDNLIVVPRPDRSTYITTWSLRPGFTRVAKKIRLQILPKKYVYQNFVRGVIRCAQDTFHNIFSTIIKRTRQSDTIHTKFSTISWMAKLAECSTMSMHDWL